MLSKQGKVVNLFNAEYFSYNTKNIIDFFLLFFCVRNTIYKDQLTTQSSHIFVFIEKTQPTKNERGELIHRREREV